MNLSLDPSVVVLPASAESQALGRWYDSQPVVRRLWAIREAHQLRVILAIEPTLDNDDIYPVWFANVAAWARELHLCTGTAVHLELVQESAAPGIQIGAGELVVAELFWRDATLIHPDEVP